MRLIPPLRGALPSGLLGCLLLSAQPVAAEQQNLEEALRRMEQLLLQQQAELETQRKQLAEQGELIRQLQAAQQATESRSEPTSIEQPSNNRIASGDADQATPGGDSQAPDSATVRLVESDADNSEVPSKADPGSAKEAALAELSRREQAAPTPDVRERDSIRDDPSNTSYRQDFPGAWHLPGTTAAMKIAGYVNLALVNSFDPMLISDRFIVGSIPPEGTNLPGAKAGTDVVANQTRINYEVREETTHGTLRAFIEADFQGSDDTFRLRHAFGQYRWGLAGKTWSTLMDIESRPDEVDFEGINGMILTRQAQVRLFPKFGDSLSFKLALEDPRTDVINGVGAKGNADLILSFDRLPLSDLSLGTLGDWNSRLAIILRDLEASQFVGDVEDGKSSGATGWGITTSGRKNVTRGSAGDFVLWQLTYGKGIGRYLNDLNTVGGGDAVFDPQGNLQPLPVFAGYASYSHGWPKDFWFLKSWPGILRSNLTLSWVSIDNFDYQDDQDYKDTLRASVNFIYLPTQNLKLGAELLWGERKNKDNSKGTALQLQVSANYIF